MADITVRRGVEGPRHDPYSWQEVAFSKTNGQVIRLRAGLGVSLWVDGKLVDAIERVDDLECHLMQVFKEMTGLSFRDALDMPDRLRERRLRSLPRAEREQIEACEGFDRQMLRNAY